MIELIMPKMGESVAEATILKWLKKEGDRIEADEAVLEIATDKVDSEVPSPAAGVLSKRMFGASASMVRSHTSELECQSIGRRSQMPILPPHGSREE